MNGDVEYDLTGGHVSFDTLWRLDQLAATLTGHLGWRVVVEVDPGITLTASPAREPDDLGWDLDASVRPSDAPLSLQDARSGNPASLTPPDATQAHTALEGA